MVEIDKTNRAKPRNKQKLFGQAKYRGRINLFIDFLLGTNQSNLITSVNDMTK